MGRKPKDSGNIKKAEQLYRKGLKLVEIAECLDVPPSTVRRSKSTYKWEESLKKTNRTFGNTKNVRSKAEVKNEALLGNGNAIGHKGRNRSKNQNAATHGAYSKEYLIKLGTGDIEMINSIDFNDEEEILIAQIKQYTAREIYLCNQLQELEKRTDNDGLMIVGSEFAVTKDDFRGANGRVGTSEVRRTLKGSELDALIKLNAELTKVQSNKVKAITSLARIRKDKAEINSIIHGGSIEAASEPITIYLPDNGREG